jgi:hypothetical protein
MFKVIMCIMALALGDASMQFFVNQPIHELVQAIWFQATGVLTYYIFFVRGL